MRKTPVLKKDIVPLVRRFKKIGTKAGPRVIEVEVTGLADEEILKMFLGRDGDRMRAPVLAAGEVIFAGSDETCYRTMLQKR